jgi:hypothetical protein
MMNETIKATGSPRPGRYHAIGKALGEDTLPTPDGFAAKTTDSGYQSYQSSCQRQVSDLATMVAVDPPTARSAASAVIGDRRTDNGKAWWYDRRRP